MRRLLVLLLWLSATTYSQQLPGKFAVTWKSPQKKGVTTRDDALYFATKVESLLVNSPLFTVFGYEKMGGKLLSEEEFLQRKFHEPTHVFTTSILVFYYDRDFGGEFAVEGTLKLQKFQDGELTGKIIKSFSSRVSSKGYQIIATNSEDLPARHKTIEVLASQLAFEMSVIFKNLFSQIFCS